MPDFLWGFFAPNRKTRWPGSQNRRPPTWAGRVVLIHSHLVGPSVRPWNSVSSPAIVSLCQMTGQDPRGGTTVSCHAHSCGWTYRIHGWAHGGERLQGPEEDASCWTGKTASAVVAYDRGRKHIGGPFFKVKNQITQHAKGQFQLNFQNALISHLCRRQRRNRFTVSKWDQHNRVFCIC